MSAFVRLPDAELRNFLDELWSLSPELIERALTRPNGAANRFLKPSNNLEVLDKVVAELQEAISDDPNSVRFWLKLGDVQLKRGDGAAAVEAYVCGAELYAARGFPLKAYAIYKQTLRVDPENADHRARAAELLAELDLWKDAVVTAMQAIRVVGPKPPKRAVRVLVLALPTEGRARLRAVLDRA